MSENTFDILAGLGFRIPMRFQVSKVDAAAGIVEFSPADEWIEKR